MAWPLICVFIIYLFTRRRGSDDLGTLYTVPCLGHPHVNWSTRLGLNVRRMSQSSKPWSSSPGRTCWGYLCRLNQSSFCSSQGQVVVQFLVSQSSPVLTAPSKSHLTCACSTNVLESVNKHTLSLSSLSSHTPSPPVSVRAWEMRDGGNDGHAAFPGRSGTGRYICSPQCNVAQQGTPTCSLVPSPQCPPPIGPNPCGPHKEDLGRRGLETGGREICGGIDDSWVEMRANTQTD